MLLNETDRKNLILHILNKEKLIDGYSKFYSIINLLKDDFVDAFGHYEFNSSFLTVKDKVLDDDLNALLFDGLATNDEVNLDLSHTHKIEISANGSAHLIVRNVERSLKSKIGADLLKKIDETVAKYNRMQINEVMTLVKSKSDLSS